MQIVVNKREFLRVLGRCHAVADKKSTMPVLGNVLLETTDKTVRLAATDLVLAVSGEVEAEIKRRGSVALGAKDLFDRVRMMPEGDIALEVGEGSQTTIKAVGGARRYTINGVPGAEFPPLPEPESGARIELDVATMLRLISATHFSISTDETRIHLSSALFEVEGETVRMVTTDGHRLSKIEMSASGNAASEKMLIPLKGILELRRLCDDALTSGESNRVKIIKSGANAHFEVSGFRFSVKLVGAQFPPYQQVIPAQSANAIRAPRVQLSEALKAVSLAASDRTGGVKLTLTNGTLRVESESPEAGAGFDEVPVDYQGAQLTIGLNAKYFLDVLNAITDDEVTLSATGELDPAVVKPSGDLDYVAVIMPMRV